MAKHWSYSSSQQTVYVARQYQASPCVCVCVSSLRVWMCTASSFSASYRARLSQQCLVQTQWSEFSSHPLRWDHTICWYVKMSVLQWNLSRNFCFCHLWPRFGGSISICAQWKFEECVTSSKALAIPKRACHTSWWLNPFHLPWVSYPTHSTHPAQLDYIFIAFWFAVANPVQTTSALAMRMLETLAVRSDFRLTQVVLNLQEDQSHNITMFKAMVTHQGLQLLDFVTRRLQPSLWRLTITLVGLSMTSSWPKLIHPELSMHCHYNTNPCLLIFSNGFSTACMSDQTSTS